ncbi:MAG: hypothetical protein JST21_18315 [Bacteroidetes bacterium]|nr:hypothetical protein [Bacteroidota bacterium]
MKKIILATLIFVASIPGAFADGKSNAKMLKDLKLALKSVSESEWVTKDTYQKTTFKFNGKTTNAYVDLESKNLIGFSVALNEDELPEGTKQNVEKKFKGWNMINPIMFINGDGHISYFVQIVKNGKSFALSVSSKGKAYIFSNILE